QESPYSNSVSTRLGSTSKEIAGADQENNNIPTRYDLSEVYPNPFNPSTTIMYELPEISNVSIVIYDMLGRTMWSSSESAKPAGYYSLKWDGQTNSGNQVTSGIYIISFSTPAYREVQKAVLIR
ncbi:MAG: T9SS type A sorting domain-containing protein, partial [Candidatus Marinimicrobia bacterium]|nr:T9SS type A sorting domain-containing protein [Candidatus Neomarinimicrobiota bacterium]